MLTLVLFLVLANDPLYRKSDDRYKRKNGVVYWGVYGLSFG